MVAARYRGKRFPDSDLWFAQIPPDDPDLRDGNGWETDYWRSTDTELRGATEEFTHVVVRYVRWHRKLLGEFGTDRRTIINTAADSDGIQLLDLSANTGFEPSGDEDEGGTGGVRARIEDTTVESEFLDETGSAYGNNNVMNLQGHIEVDIVVGGLQANYNESFFMINGRTHWGNPTGSPAFPDIDPTNAVGLDEFRLFNRNADISADSGNDFLIAYAFMDESITREEGFQLTKLIGEAKDIPLTDPTGLAVVMDHIWSTKRARLSNILMPNNAWTSDGAVGGKTLDTASGAGSPFAIRELDAPFGIR